MCTRYYEEGETFPDSVRAEVAQGIAHLEAITGKTFGDATETLAEV
jgi:pyruvate,orthophosphate dikinase